MFSRKFRKEKLVWRMIEVVLQELTSEVTVEVSRRRVAEGQRQKCPQGMEEYRTPNEHACSRSSDDRNSKLQVDGL